MLYNVFLNQRSGVGGMKINSTTWKLTWKLFADACCTALAAFLVGLCLARTIKHSDGLYITGLVLSGAFLMVVLYWARRAARRLAASETARKSASTFLWSCICFSMITLSLGMQVSGFVWHGSDFIRRFSVIFWSGIAGIAIYPVLRDAKRLADAAGPNHFPVMDHQANK
jgi:uncharacterized membrane-anchored protein